MSILQLTDIQIFNQALMRNGVTSPLVTAVDGSDTSKYGKLASPLYQLTRDEELRNGDWEQVIKRAQLVQAQVTQTACTWTSGSAIIAMTSNVGIKVGWVLGTGLILGNPPALPPAGIPAGSTVLSVNIDGIHVTISNNATANGSGQIVFQVDNESGYWYAYEEPGDEILLLDVYAVFPASILVWPFKVQNQVRYPFIHEAGYIYTNIDQSNGNPIAKYIYEPAAGTPPFASDFTEALIMRLAGKLSMPIHGDLNIKKDINQEYSAVQARASGNSKMEASEEDMGEDWWRP